MKILIGEYENTSYSFNSTNGTITILNLKNIKLENVLMITNMTTGTVVFSPIMSLTGTISNNVIDLTYNTSAMNNNDSLQILVEIDDPNTANSDILHYLKQMVKLLEPGGTVDSNNRQRVVVDSAPTTTVTMATTGGANVTGIGYPTTSNAVGGNPYALTAAQPTQLVASIVDQRWELAEFSHISYQNIRNKLTFS